MAIVILSMVGTPALMGSEKPKEFTYTEFVKAVSEGRVDSAMWQNENIYGKL